MRADRQTDEQIYHSISHPSRAYRAHIKIRICEYRPSIHYKWKFYGEKIRRGSELQLFSDVNLTGSFSSDFTLLV